MSEFVTASAAVDRVSRLWLLRFVGEFAAIPVRLRADLPALAYALDGASAPGGVRRLVDVWGELDGGDPRAGWLFSSWPSLTDALDELLMSALFDSGGF